MAEQLFIKGTRVWIQHPELVWVGAEVVEDFASRLLKVKTESGKVQTLKVTSDETLPPLRNPHILIGANDLTSLSYLHEPAVLYSLQVRFCQQLTIYTYCGIVLVAINPYDDLPIYDANTIWAYRGQAMGNLEPHIFAVAEEAYTKLKREERDQSIIVSGESGAGKTVSAKYAMRYFATVGGATTETQIEKKVLVSSTIMEAMGNAKTTRNDNSSRFGKFIEIHFGKSLHIQGASMRTYLLEKSRVVFQARDERNYHVFYQLCASRQTLPHLHLLHQDEFYYLGQGKSPSIDGVDDAATFEETTTAFSLLGFSQKEQANVFRVLAAILHLGNVVIEEAVIDNHGDEGCAMNRNDVHLKHVSELLELDASELRKWLCTRKIVSMTEVFFKPMTVREAMGARDALAKHIYAELFGWIVSVVNKALETSSQVNKFIGVLDIYGFEMFDTNSFEQFCINYANEKLQQQFNQHVFKLEQEEYVKEEIAWTLIDFHDNQPCIDLIENRLGILDLLDEECRMPKGTDSSWTEKLYKNCSKYKHFARPRFGTTAFVIHHFADKVTYQSNGFLEKNRDTVIEDQIKVVGKGKNELMNKLFAAKDDKKLKVPAAEVTTVPGKPAASPQSSAKQRKKTVGLQFADSLNMLMSTLNATTRHYVRCIKPNDDKVAFRYDPTRVVQQLRACGVLETIRISAAGFPSRCTYSKFFHRYRFLCLYKDIMRDNMRGTCECILANTIKGADKYRFGKTKIFFRAGQVGYLEKLRADKLEESCIIIQKQVRAFICRKKYLRKVHATRCLQRYARGYMARRRVHHIRRTRAAITIQRHVRGWVKRSRYTKARSLVLRLQARCRGFLARRLFSKMFYNSKAIVVQKCVRGWLARVHYRRSLRCVVVVQSCARRWLARRQFKKLKTETRLVEHVKKLNKGLENKIISLQHKIGNLTKENNTLKSAQTEVIDLRAKLDGLKSLEAELKREAALALAERDSDVTTLKGELEREREEKMDLLNEKNRLENSVEKINEENVALKTELDRLNIRMKDNEIEAEDNLKMRVAQEKAFVNQEHDQDRIAYQKLLTDYNVLKQRSEGLERGIARLQQDAGSNPAAPKGHHRTSSNASTVSAISELPDDDLQEKLDDMAKLVRKLKGQIRLLKKKLMEAGVDTTAESKSVLNTRDEEFSPSTILRKKERNYRGMLEYRKGDERLIVRHLIQDLNPRLAATLVPGLPAFIVLMCIRHADLENDVRKAHKLLIATIGMIEQVVKERRDDLDTTVLWLSNTLRLLHNLKQYSGDKKFQSANTAKQNEQCLRNFDLSQYHSDLVAVVNLTYIILIRHMEEKVKPMIVPAILEHEAITGLSGQKPRLSVRGPEPPAEQNMLDVLQQELTTFHRSLESHAVDPELIVLTFKQLLVFINAWAFNNLVLRKDLCHWAKGKQIRNDLCQLEQWTRDHRMQEEDVLAPLQPIIQAAQLLQACKAEEDVQSVCDMCDRLSVNQVVKILNNYSPAEKFEERVPIRFIRRVQAALTQAREGTDYKPMLLMDTCQIPYPRFTHNPSNILLEDIEIPVSLNLTMLKRV